MYELALSFHDHFCIFLFTWLCCHGYKANTIISIVIFNVLQVEYSSQGIVMTSSDGQQGIFIIFIILWIHLWRVTAKGT